jgi:hypothetical protein
MRGRWWRSDLVHAAHVVHGGALLLRPAAVAARADGGAHGGTVAVVRVLGARHVVQGLAGLAAAGRRAVLLGTAVDGVHAASMVGLAALARSHRRGAGTSALVALGFAVGGWWAAHRDEPARAGACPARGDRAWCTTSGDAAVSVVGSGSTSGTM